MNMSVAQYRLLMKSVPKGVLKYRNRPVEVDGERYRSTKEMIFHVQCKVQTKARDPALRIVKIEREVYYPLVPAQRDKAGRLLERAMGYYLDFRLTYADGRVEHVDVKSIATRKIPTYRIKRKLMLERHGIHILEV